MRTPKSISFLSIGIIFIVTGCNASGKNIPVTQTPWNTPTASPTNTGTNTATTPPLTMPNLRLVYLAEDGDWFIDPSSSPVKLPGLTDKEYGDLLGVSLSDDSTKVVYLFNYMGLIAGNSDGSGTRVELSQTEISSLEATNEPQSSIINQDSIKWIPGTHGLFFNTMHTVPTWGLGPYDNLFIINTDDGSISRVFKAGAGGRSWPSPDGTKMAVEGFDSFFLASINGEIIFNNFPALNTKLPISEVAWTANSSGFGIMVPSGDARKNEDASKVEIWSIHASNGDAVSLGTIDQYGYGELSPTLEYLVCKRDGEDSSGDEMYVGAVDGSKIIKIAAGSAEFISFSPDGRYFAYYEGSFARPLSYCVGDSPIQKVMIGSMNGETIQVIGANHPDIFRWINNSQYVYAQGYTINLGDVWGNSTVLHESKSCIGPLDAKDLDFQKPI